MLTYLPSTLAYAVLYFDYAIKMLTTVPHYHFISPQTAWANLHINFTQVQSAGHFWVTSSEGNSASCLQEIQMKMERTVQQGVAHHLPYKLVTPGRPVIAEYTDPYDKITGYYRARVEEIFPGPDEKTLRALVRIFPTG